MYRYRDFLDKLRQPQAADIVNSMKTFIDNFYKKTQPDNFPQAVRDFMETTEALIERHPLWENSTDEQIDNAREGLEKLLMTRIYSRVFTPTEE